MKKLIDKSALVAEIERKINEINLDNIEDWRCRIQREHDIKVMKNILSLIDTLEEKEVDLEKEIYDTFLENKCNITDNVSLAEFVRIAKYFFELGLKTKGK